LQFGFFSASIKQLFVLKGVRTWKTKKTKLQKKTDFEPKLQLGHLYAIIKQLLASKVVRQWSKTKIPNYNSSSILRVVQ
jgi:hypothetical protein